MNKKTQRILLIVLMVAILVYTVINFFNHPTNKTSFVIMLGFLVFLLFGQISALIREWND